MCSGQAVVFSGTTSAANLAVARRLHRKERALLLFLRPLHTLVAWFARHFLVAVTTCESVSDEEPLTALGPVDSLHHDEVNQWIIHHLR